MKSEGFGKHLLFVFVITLAVYAGFYQADKWFRVRKGPWEAEFATGEGAPVLRIHQAALGIESEVRFLGEGFAGSATNLVFNDVLRTNVPFGVVVFQDLTYLPGTVTLNCFGHEIEMLPRTLVINRKPVAWSEAESVDLSAKEKLPPDVLKAKKR